MPRVPNGGIAAYLLGLLASPLGEAYELQALDVAVPELFRRHRWLRPLFTLHLLGRLTLQILRERPRLVHVHTSDFGGFWEKSALAWLARATRRPVVMHLHGGSFDRFLASLPPRPARWAAASLSAAARTVVLSEAWRPLVERFAPRARVEVHPNAIRCAEFDLPRRPDPNPVPQLLFVGMISTRKGLDELMEALLELRLDPRTPFEMDVVGDEEFPGERARNRARFAAAGLGDVVRFPGAAYGAVKLGYLQRADVFVLPSRSESFGIANLEAMAAGLPLVTTRTGAIPEYVTHGVHGLLVNPGDAAGLTVALRTLLLDPALRRRLGDAGRLRARDYDWDIAARRMAGMYEQVLARTPDRVRATAP